MSERWTNIKNSVATGSGALAHTLAPGRAFRLLEVRLHLSAAATQETLTITADSNEGAAYDLVFDSQAMAGVVDHVYRPAHPAIFMKGDELDFAWGNTDARTFGLEIIYQEL